MDPTDLFDKFIPVFDELEQLYARMDRMYDNVAGVYGFKCSGCTDNCCLTRFFHHTLAEFLYLGRGFAGLDKEMQKRVRQSAARVNEEVRQAEDSGQSPRVMCPLNHKGLCILYRYRPMICRLHGIPHEFMHPVRGKIVGPGCHEFETQCSQTEYLAFNRTSFYREMAKLESRLREMTGITDKFKKTVAQMLVQDLERFI